MDIIVSEQGGAQVVAISGEVDLSTSPKVRESLLNNLKSAKGVVVDLSGVSYIDSSGVASLVEAFQVAKSKNQGFVLASIGETPLRVLKLARLDQVFVIVDSVDEGVSSVA